MRVARGSRRSGRWTSERCPAHAVRLPPGSFGGREQVSMMIPVDQFAVIGATRRWISSVVIGLNLCPFARPVFAADKIRYVVSDAGDEDGLLRDLAGEVQALAASPISAVETTLLIHPHVLGDFLDYN